MKIRTKLLAAFGFMILLQIAAGIMSNYSVQQLSATQQGQVSIIAELETTAHALRLIKEAQEIPTDYLAVNNKADRSAYEDVDAELATLLRKAASETGLPQTRELWAKAERHMPSVTLAAHRILALENPVGHPETPGLMEKLDQEAVILDGVLQELNQWARAESARLQDEARAQEQLIRLLLIGLSALSAAAGIAVALITVRHLSQPIRQASAWAQQIRDGDLRIGNEARTDRKDELGHMINTLGEMASQLHQLVGQVADSIRTVGASAYHLTRAAAAVNGEMGGVGEAAAQVAEGAEVQSRSLAQAQYAVSEWKSAVAQIAAGAQNQAASAQQAVTTVSDMAGSIEETASMAESVSDSAARTAGAAHQGNVVIQENLAVMDRIRQAVDRSAAQVTQLGSQSTQIGEITRVITDIAGQTNLLALNAAIEAARAGEHGRGFAVVADEVRKLAERAATSAREITQLIQGVQSGVSASVLTMQEALSEVAAGTAHAADAGASLQDILDQAERTRADAGAISRATRDLAAASERMLEAVNEVAAVTEENTTATEEMSATSDTVSDHIGGVVVVSEQNAQAARAVSASVENAGRALASVQRAVDDLSRVAGDLAAQIDRFAL